MVSAVSCLQGAAERAKWAAKALGRGGMDGDVKNLCKKFDPAGSDNEDEEAAPAEEDGPNASMIERAIELQRLLFPELVARQQAVEERFKDMSEQEQLEVELLAASHNSSGLGFKYRELPEVELESIPELQWNEITAADFREQFVMRNCPLILRGAVQGLGWKALDWCDDEYFANKVGHHRVKVRRRPMNCDYRKVRRFSNKDEKEVSMEK